MFKNIGFNVILYSLFPFILLAFAVISLIVNIAMGIASLMMRFSR